MGLFDYFRRAPDIDFVSYRGGNSTATVFATVTFYVIVLTMYLYLFPMLAIEQEEGRGLLGRRPRLYKSSVAMPDLVTHLVYVGAILNVVCSSWAFSTYFGNSDDATIVEVFSNYEEYKPIWALGGLCLIGCLAPFFIRGMTKIAPLPQLATEEDQPWNNRWLKIMDISVDESKVCSAPMKTAHRPVTARPVSAVVEPTQTTSDKPGSVHSMTGKTVHGPPLEIGGDAKASDVGSKISGVAGSKISGAAGSKVSGAAGSVEGANAPEGHEGGEVVGVDQAGNIGGENQAGDVAAAEQVPVPELAEEAQP